MVQRQWQRARQPEQKEQRRTAILEAALELFEDGGFDNVSLNAVARAAGIAKSNVYRYFESKELIFLHLLQEDLMEWVAALERVLAPLAGRNDLEAVARQMTETVASRPRLGALTAVASSVLERNVTADAVFQLKRSMFDLIVRLANALHAAIPDLTPQQARELPILFHVLVAGLWPASHPPPIVEQVMKRPELEGMSVDFSETLERATLLLLRGMLPS